MNPSKTTLPPTIQKLPVSYQDKFKTLCDHHEKQDWKKALKTAGEILAAYPSQADTLSMKGLVLLSAPEKEGGNKKEGVELLKKGLTESRFTSYICWHAYGLYHRSEKQYDEASKCYTRALKLYADNLTILRDLAYLQTQLRDFQGLFETRKKILKLRPDIDFYWFSTAVAAYLCGEDAVALRLSETGIQHYRTTFKGVLARYDEKPDLKRKEAQARTNAWLQNKAELNGLHMFRVTVFAETGKHAEVLAELDSAGAEVTDKLGAREARAAALTKLGRSKEAVAAYDELLRINPDSLDYHRGRMAALGIEPGDAAAVLPYADKVAAEHPRSVFCKIFRLIEYDRLADEATFRGVLEKFIGDGVARGLPSIFQALKGPVFRSSSAKNGRRNLALADAIAADIIAKARAGKPIVIDDVTATSSPTDLLWGLHFGAQTASALGDHETAKARVEEAIKHTPTLLDLYTCKARVLRHAGDAAGAAEAYAAARKMDLADRYLCNRAAKYLMAAGRTEEARETMALFLKAEDGTPDVVLANLQCMWYEWGMAEAFARKGELGMALKKYLAIVKNYQEFKEAQFDFHYYAFKKCTISEYLRMLRFAERIPALPRFVASAAKALTLYMDIAALSKDRVAAIVKEHEPLSAAAHAMHKKKSALPEDSDPLGDKLLAAEDPLGDAIKLYKSIVATFREIKAPEIHIAAAKVALAKKDRETAEAAIEAAKKADPENAEVAELAKKL